MKCTLQNMFDLVQRQMQRTPHMKDKGLLVQVDDGEPSDDFVFATNVQTNETILRIASPKTLNRTEKKDAVPEQDRPEVQQPDDDVLEEDGQ